MAINNLNPRRTVWFSPHEPSNKYDIWLSKNAHYDENGEPTTDSNAQRDCDYIFKIYDCNKWLPIVGFNSTARYKINVVDGVEYSCTLPNNFGNYSVTGYTGFHMPLFRDDDSSPYELFDAGTVANVLTKFVSEEEWKTIIESGGLGGAVEYSFPYAGHSRKGGIWADMFNNLTHADTSTASKTYLALAKYKYQSILNNYDLFVHAKDMISAISTYQTDNPGEGISVPKATLDEYGGIKSGQWDDSSDHLFFRCWFGNHLLSDNTYGTNPQTQIMQNEDLLYTAINLDSLIDHLGNNIEQYFVGINGVGVSYGRVEGENNEYYQAVITQLNNLEGQKAGLYCRSTQDSTTHENDIEWVIPRLNELDDVDLNSPTSGQILMYNGLYWENTNFSGGTEYTAGLGIYINQTNNIISLNIEELEEYQGGLKSLTLLQKQDGSITISDDNTELLTVNPYEIQYLDIPGCQSISITLLKSCTNPVYIYLKTEYDLTINSELSYNGDGLSNDKIKAGNVLITALFGIAKIEYINNFDPNV